MSSGNSYFRVCMWIDVSLSHWLGLEFENQNEAGKKKLACPHIEE